MSSTMTGPVRVLGWHLTTFRRMWRLNLFSSFVQPMLYLLGLGVGVGTLVDANSSSTDLLGGVSYVAFVAPGLLVSTAMTLASIESMWPVMAGLRWTRGYHGIAASPLDATDIVLGHGLWIAIRSGIACSAVALALACFDDTRSWGLVPAIPVAMLVALAFGLPIMAYSVNAEMDGSFAAIQRFVVIPLFLFGGAFYPLTQLPDVVQWIARAAPLWHGVEVARSMTTGGFDAVAALAHLGYCALFAVVGAVFAIRRLDKKLYP
jgi:lipooligosaccharide transport system permease protein